MAKEPKTPDEKDVQTPNAAKKNSVIIDINPTLESVDLLKFNKTAVVTLLKVSPPTLETDEFIDHLYDVATAHSVEQPMVFVQDTDNSFEAIETSTSTGDSGDEVPEEFFWLAPEDAFSLASEAYGDIVQKTPVRSVYDLLDTLLQTYTNVVLVLPEEEAKLIHRAEHNVEVFAYRDFDEVAIATDMYKKAVANDQEGFATNLAEGIEYLAPEIMEIYQIYTMDVDQFDEALNYAQRLKRAQVFRRNKRKIAVARERMKHKIATTDQLKVRARHKAIQSIRKKVAGARGVDYQNLGVGEKIQIDKRVEQRKGAIGRIAAKILPSLRKQELQKMSHKATNEAVVKDAMPLIDDPDEIKRLRDLENQAEAFDPADLPSNKAKPLVKPPGAPVEKKKVWHQMFNKDGSIKLDKRFRIWRDPTFEESVDLINTVVDNPEVSNVIEALLVKADEYNINEEVIRELFNRGTQDAAYEHLDPVQAGFNRVNSFIAGSYFLEDLELMERAEAGACAIISKEDLKELEKFADALLDKFGIDVGFTKHFGERMSDSRNTPCITVQELRDFFRKIAMKQGKDIKSSRDPEVVLKDVQRNLNIPVVIDYKNGEFDVTLKTIMRKKDFRTPDKIIRY